MKRVISGMTPAELTELRMRCGLHRKEAVYQSGYAYSSWKNFETGFSPIPVCLAAWMRTYHDFHELKRETERLKDENAELRIRLRKEARP